MLVGANPLEHAAGVPYTDPGATASDVIDGDLSSAVTTGGTVNYVLPGAYTVRVSVTNTAGMTTELSRQVNVADTTDGCTPDPCVHGACADTVTGYTCTCSSGWTGSTCNVERPRTCLVVSRVRA